MARVSHTPFSVMQTVAPLAEVLSRVTGKLVTLSTMSPAGAPVG